MRNYGSLTAKPHEKISKTVKEKCNIPASSTPQELEMPKKSAEKELKLLKKKYSKLKKYTKQLEKQLEGTIQPAKTSKGGKKSSKGGAEAAKPKADKSNPKDAANAKAPATKPKTDRDNLKQIQGIGAVLEKRLNAAGITRFAQIAKWTEKEIAALPKELNVGTRPQREDWIGQAKKLA